MTDLKQTDTSDSHVGTNKKGLVSCNMPNNKNMAGGSEIISEIKMVTFTS